MGGLDGNGAFTYKFFFTTFAHGYGKIHFCLKQLEAVYAIYCNLKIKHECFNFKRRNKNNNFDLCQFSPWNVPSRQKLFVKTYFEIMSLNHRVDNYCISFIELWEFKINACICSLGPQIYRQQYEIIIIHFLHMTFWPECLKSLSIHIITLTLFYTP